MTGAFYGANALPKSNSNKLIPIKENLPTNKYGGYSGVEQAYYCIIEFDKKKNRQLALVGIPVKVSYDAKKDNNAVFDYINSLKEYSNKNIVIKKEKIKKYQLIEMDGMPYYIVSAGELQNSRQLILSEKSKKTIYLMKKYYPIKNEDDKAFDDDLIECIKEILDKIKKYYPCYNTIYQRLNADIGKIINMPIETKIAFINELLKVTSANSVNGNFSKFGLSYKEARAGRLKKIPKIDYDTVFINKSPTGIFESRYKIGV